MGLKSHTRPEEVSQGGVKAPPMTTLASGSGVGAASGNKKDNTGDKLGGDVAPL